MNGLARILEIKMPPSFSLRISLSHQFLPGPPDTLRIVGLESRGTAPLLNKEARESASLMASKPTPTHRSAPTFDGIPLLSHKISGFIPPPIHRPDDWSNCAAPTWVTCRSEGVRYSATVSRSAPPSGKGKVCWISPFPKVFVPITATVRPLSRRADTKTSAEEAVPSFTRSTRAFCFEICRNFCSSLAVAATVDARWIPLLTVCSRRLAYELGGDHSP
mmetsp:Transcript_9638/g.18399  ORF Transcript_9638/g.18399 Transcript_9638/m.18399 type:complete len:219 (+) Transcript_9638:97-753(+)